MNYFIPGYNLRRGSPVDRSLLVKFMQRTYQEMLPHQDFSHLARTVDQYLSPDTPLWWVDSETSPTTTPIACLWVGNAIDQVTGIRHPHIFLLYVAPEHRRKGIGTGLMHYLEDWAKQRGDRQIGLQVFASNTPALNLYHQLGYRTESLWMLKSLD
ncbi:MAG TPA: GNAT family N-acetyltransferase [Nostocaceae cyanobacterium]|nr:GNAT family N-acetyltransferase [Nostocaceae cyanobacterium]